jgi:hypothetical protein
MRERLGDVLIWLVAGILRGKLRSRGEPVALTHA